MTDVPQSTIARIVDRFFHRDRIEYGASWAQIISAAAVVISLVFVGKQLRDANRVAVRSEANSTQVQWSELRSSIYGNRDTATLLRAGVEGRVLDAVDQMRFRYLMREFAWATYQLWDRVRSPPAGSTHFVARAGPNFLRIVCTPGGRAVWAGIKGELPRNFIEDLDRLEADYARQNAVRCR